MEIFKVYVEEGHDFLYIFYDRGQFDYVAAGNCSYLTERYYIYKGEIINEPWELDAEKYNL